MKWIAIAAWAVLLSACGTRANIGGSDNPVKIRVQFEEPKDERYPHLQIRKRSWMTYLDGNNGSAQFPLVTATACNSERTSCKQAVVKSGIVLNGAERVDGAVRITGVLKSEMGRSKTLKTLSASSTNETTSTISAGVAVIGEEVSEQPFNLRILPGAETQLRGLGGIVIFIDAP
ncbi:MAG: hypothetical protein EOO32_00040 [Comamonadaceae bacterium]|nr:MAG: hypothetical protein EOO32_00040 [Comamonadaceae bacterium]